MVAARAGPGAGHPVGGADLGRAPALDLDRGDDQAGFDTADPRPVVRHDLRDQSGMGSCRQQGHYEHLTGPVDRWLQVIGS